MTGFARCQGHDTVLAWSWEVKSVNGKGLEARFRLPGGYDFLEQAARDALQKKIRRGNLNVTLTVDRISKDTPFAVNEAVLAQYVEIATRWQEKAPSLAPASIDGLMALRGVLDQQEEEPSPEEIERRGRAMTATFLEALSALSVMRGAEGARLDAVLRGHLSEISQLVTQAEALASMAPEAVQDRLVQLLTPLLDGVPALTGERLAQEAALIAAKADVREELDRLKSHIAAALDLLGSGEAVGRRLDFLCQEFNREANTLCSKANDIELTRIGLALKAIIEQFREQVQNIE